MFACLPFMPIYLELLQPTVPSFTFPVFENAAQLPDSQTQLHSSQREQLDWLGLGGALLFAPISSELIGKGSVNRAAKEPGAG